MLLMLIAMLMFFHPSSAIAASTDSMGVGQALGLPLAKPAPALTPAAAPAIPTSAPAATINTQPPQFFDYSSNLASDVFGAHLFTGSFARQGATQFNPNYAVTIGDNVQVRMWGAYELDSLLTVDPKGNIFLPHIGPVKVLGVRNQDLQKVVDAAVRRTFRSNVFSYASLAAAQPVRVFVSGFVHRPGLYNGTSMDSLLHYLDQAGGIDPDRGSFLDVQVKRGSSVRAKVNLYEFLLEGRMPLVQLADGDVIFVTSRRNTVKVLGFVENPKRFEFAPPALSVTEIIEWAKPLAKSTNVRVVRNSGTTKNVEYYSIEECRNVTLQNGDELEFTADKKPGTITVRVEGEHLSAQEYVLPYGARLGDLLQQVQFSERSEEENIQLFRLSVKERQKTMLLTALKNLEATVLTARSATNEEAQLRKTEADLILQWVERAKNIEPTGQVLIAQSKARNQLLLENGDILRVPTRDGLLLVSGEVLFPNTIAFDPKLDLDAYIHLCGGYTQKADTSRIVIAHRDGSFEDASPSVSPIRERDSTFEFQTKDKGKIRAGDEIMVLPKIDTKSLEIGRAITQILYQIAVSARVLLTL
jgi:protein involved in polysaccharide export with SLBB domain